MSLKYVIIVQRKKDIFFGFSLAYSYLLPLVKVLTLGKIQINLVFRSLIRTFAPDYG